MRCAMVLAAGLGLRMRPLTENTAKPLLPLGGRTLLDHALDRLEAAGVERVVINTHWQGNRVQDHLASRKKSGLEIILRPETALLDTGGAVRSALRDGVLGEEPFFIVNGDSFWLDGPTPALGRVTEAFGPDVDSVLLLHRTFQVHSEVGFGDFALDPWGKIRRRKEREIAPYLFAGVQLASPALFAAAPAGPFSLNALWDSAIAAGRLRALVHDGLWFHLSRPSDLSEAETALTARETGETR